jgi:hypothetical protein
LGCSPNFAKGASDYLLQLEWVLYQKDLIMRVLMTAMALALITLPAHAQGMGGGHKHRQDAQKTTDKAKTKADEEAYKEALKRIPAPKEKPDPWKSMR